jgi:tetratricopeptide (TPR) repeat protein
MIPETLEDARQHQLAGDLVQAERRYRRIVEANPTLQEALCALGSITYRQGKYAEASTWLARAVAGQGADPFLHNSLGAAYRAAGRLVEAEASYRQALQLKPDFAEAYNNLANVLMERGQRAEALARYRQAILTRPGCAEAHNNLGQALLQGELTPTDLSEAAIHFREALRLQPALADAQYGLGAVLFKQGQLGEARLRFEEAVRLQPSLADAHFQIGQILRKQGQAEQALPHLFEALRLKTMQAPAAPDANPLPPPETEAQDLSAGATLLPSPAESQVQQGLALKNQGKPDEAVAALRQAVEIDPDSPQAYQALGSVLRKQGRLEEAAAAFFHLVRLQPERAEAYLSLGTVLREQVQLERALAVLREALRLRPDLAEAHLQLGLALTDQGLLEEAESALREALRLQPDRVAALGQLGSLLEELGQAEEGRRLVARAISLHPENVEVCVHHGISQVNQGRFEDARMEFLRALSLRPECGAAYFFLAKDVKHSFAADEMSRMEGLLGRDDLPLRDRVNLHFALARIYDRAEDFDRAFFHCDQGNAHKRELLRRQGNEFDAAAHARLVERLIATFTPEYFARVHGFGSQSDLPAFIVGMPRSGTTLVEQILASHPDVLGAGELRNMKRLLTGLPSEVASLADYPECLSRLDRDAADRVAERYLEDLQRLGGDRLRVADKLPMNFHHLGLIATLFPRAQIIHCRRDPRDVCWSCYFQNFREIYFASDLKVLGDYERLYERLMSHWRAVLPVPIYEVVYEEIVENPERVSRELVAFCGLPWHDSCLTFYKTRRVVRTSSNFQVRRPVYKGSVGYWKNYARHLGPLLEALGSSQ